VFISKLLFQLSLDDLAHAVAGQFRNRDNRRRNLLAGQPFPAERLDLVGRHR